MWIQRDISFLLQNAAQESPAVALIGARQTGKTSLLKQYFPEHRYVTLDDPAVALEADQDGLTFLKKHKDPIIIDEIQYAQNLFRSLKVKIDEERKRNGRFLLTGSQRFELMTGVSESLAGRIQIIELLSLSTLEIERALGRTVEGDDLANLITQGGYPEIHSDSRTAESFFKSYIPTYIERDVRQLINIKSARDFDRFLRLCAARTGQLLSSNALASELGLSATAVRNWLDILVASQIIALVEPWYSKTTKRIIKTPKLYFLDTGLCCHLLNIRNGKDLLTSPFLGHLFETHVYGQLLRTVTNSGRAQPIHFFRDHDGHEIDFVLPHAGRFHLFEVKWSSNPKIESRNRDAFRKHYGADSESSFSLVCNKRGHIDLKLQGAQICDSVDFTKHIAMLR